MTTATVAMTRQELRQILGEEILDLIRQNANVRYGLIGFMAETFAQRTDIQSILEHLDTLREDFNRRMDEHSRRMDEFAQRQEEHSRRMDEFAQRQEEHSRRLDEQGEAIRALREDFNRRMTEFAQRQEEHSRRLDEQGEAIRALREDFNRQMVEFSRRQDKFDRRLDEFDRRMDERDRRLESHVSALGARWGIMAEESFRHGLAGILDDHFGLQVERFWQMDPAGQVFGRPDQVEIDVVVHDGAFWLMELKSSMSRGDVYLFERKVAFYEGARDVKAERKIIISPMVERGAEKVAQMLGMEVYTSAYDLEV